MGHETVLFLLLCVAAAGLIGQFAWIAWLYELRATLENRMAKVMKIHKQMANQLANAKRFIWETDQMKGYRDWYLKPSLLEDGDVIPWKDPLDPALVEKISTAFKNSKKNIEDAEVLDVITLPDRMPRPSMLPAPAPAAQLNPFGFVPRA